MKKVIGIIAVLLTVAFITILGLRVWGIEVVSMQTLIRSNLTLALLGGLIVLLIIMYGFFFKNNTDGYDSNVGNRAHPKKDGLKNG
ncbi:MAG: hypothetical protein ABIP95_10920 [Pelobium sp.]